jgi:hypothetical protein
MSFFLAQKECEIYEASTALLPESTGLVVCFHSTQAAESDN